MRKPVTHHAALSTAAALLTGSAIMMGAGTASAAADDHQPTPNSASVSASVRLGGPQEERSESQDRSEPQLQRSESQDHRDRRGHRTHNMESEAEPGLVPQLLRELF
ncbi:Xre family transcriptional regulator [Streptomyces sp. NBRC 110611]|uniref:hypothetical protein n=1 Tax=Streptomyces sp. NBRC 110611 TaxID=1621259 RepID=UPI000834BB69|nr:hypothetical protein [Streptomyces sp. NBRC 110611]GAU65595.1 Xre family transcriptional regulator [Streptomyces sp. NBRC 110611]